MSKINGKPADEWILENKLKITIKLFKYEIYTTQRKFNYVRI